MYVDGIGANWGPYLSVDLFFGLFEESILIDAVSGTDSGFVGTPDNSDPYTSAQQVAYTVQPADNLEFGVTYYWRVRASDPDGSDSWGDWSDTQDFTVTSLAVAPNVVTSAATVYQPTIVPGSVTVSPNIVNSTSTVYQPAVSHGGATVTPNLIASTATVYAPAVVGTLFVSPNLIASTAIVLQPLVTIGTPIQPNTIVSTVSVYQPAITTGSVTVAPNLVTSAATVYQPVVTNASAPTIYPDFITGGAIVYQVVLTLYSFSDERIYRVEAENRTVFVEA
jgi:hypothetical protein